MSRGVFERPKGSGMWWIRYADAHGREHREKVGAKSIAIEAYYIRKAEIREGRFITPKERRVSRVTFGELADMAIEAKRGHNADGSVRNDEFTKKRVAKRMGSLPAASITSSEIESYLLSLKTEERCGPTVNRYRSFISSVFSYAVRTKKLERNPVKDVPRYKEHPSRVRFLDEAEETKLRETIRELYPQYESEVDIALHTGARRGEQFHIKWRDVDFKRGFVRVDGKTGPRHIEMNSVARAALLKLQRNAGTAVYVCEDAKRAGQRDWRRWFEECVKAAGIEDFTWHDLRHTFASRLVMAGVDLRTVQELMGHKSITQTMKYAHLSQAHRRAAVEKLTGTTTGTQEIEVSTKVVQMK